MKLEDLFIVITVLALVVPLYWGFVGIPNFMILMLSVVVGVLIIVLAIAEKQQRRSDDMILKLAFFSIKKMDIRQKVRKVYSIVSFFKRASNQALLHYYIL